MPISKPIFAPVVSKATSTPVPPVSFLTSIAISTSFGSRTTSAPALFAYSCLIDFLCNTTTNFAPAAFKHSIVARPIGPEPSTMAVSPVLKLAILIE